MTTLTGTVTQVNQGQESGSTTQHDGVVLTVEGTVGDNNAAFKVVLQADGSALEGFDWSQSVTVTIS